MLWLNGELGEGLRLGTEIMDNKTSQGLALFWVQKEKNKSFAHKDKFSYCLHYL